MTHAPAFGWTRILRLGLVQASLGAIVVLTTSTLNRVMVVELALPALLPGLLLALHYAVQISRPRMGHGTDTGRRCTPWILGGMLTLAGGAWLAALAVAWMGSNAAAGTGLAVLAFVLIGLGVSASGTSLLTLLAKRVAAPQRAAAATAVWMMMIAGFVVTAGTVGQVLDPYSPMRLLAVAGAVALAAVAITALALRGLEGTRDAAAIDTAATVEPRVDPSDRPAFRAALAEVWREPRARRFTFFVFLSMLAFSAQDLILEPFAGMVFGLSPGASTSLSGVQHAGTLIGMLMASAAGSRWAGHRAGSLRQWMVLGCVASALALSGLAAAGVVGDAWPLKANVLVLGVATGAFSIAAIASMMSLAGEGGGERQGLRVGLWGAAQAIAFALGGVVGTGSSDTMRALVADPGLAYAAVFALDAALFLGAASLALRLDSRAADDPASASAPWSRALRMEHP